MSRYEVLTQEGALVLKRKAGSQLVISLKGGELLSWQTEDGKERLWQGDQNYWDETAPWLFPFTGRLYEGAYRFNGKRYEMPLHGFLKMLDFEVLEDQGDGCMLKVSSNDETRAIYPFDFSVRLRYLLLNHGYQAEVTVFHSRESGEPTLFYALGGHPGFNLSHPLSSYLLDLPQVDPATLEQASFSQNGLVTGTKRLPAELWQDGEAEPCVNLGQWNSEKEDLFILNPGSRLRLRSTLNSEVLHLEMEGYRLLGLWRAKDAPYLCLEPWTSLPGREGILEDLADMPGRMRLDAGEQASFRYRVHLA